MMIHSHMMSWGVDDDDVLLMMNWGVDDDEDPLTDDELGYGLWYDDDDDPFTNDELGCGCLIQCHCFLFLMSIETSSLLTRF